MCLVAFKSFSQGSVPKQWVNENLNAIRNDFARPPIHARNLFHLSAGMYDAWAAFEPDAETYLLGKNLHGFNCPFVGILIPESESEKIEAQEMAISYFAYRLLRHRYLAAPGAFLTFQSLDAKMQQLGYPTGFNSVNYVEDGPAALGNYLAEQWIAYGMIDGSNEGANYASQYYQTANPPIEPELNGNPEMIDPNRWQAISLPNALDQAGNPIQGVPPFVAPEWGNVFPFAMDNDQLTIHQREGNDYKVYHIPENPPLLDTNVQTGLEDFLKWNHILVSVWQSHLDPSDNTMWDISPNNLGNITSYPNSWTDYPNFYNLFDGGDPGTGYTLNPVTGLPYTPQIVKRADYARVLAEFWADGVDSETPPGHWFEIYNKVRIHPLFENKWRGTGPLLSDLDYDVKAYLSLGGAMHDAAISAWSIKGWFDTPRPVSMIRFMADRGQSTNPSGPHYHPAGLPLIPGHIELVEPGDPLAGAMNENVNKIKLYTWRGPDFIADPETDVAGVGWILAENWWPYQRPTFVTPPFAGYISGHSTYSSAAANVMTFITGTPFFPGGMSDFIAFQEDFLEFENGPSQTIALQWATYKDAADQCSLSRIWGGIHPPIDDIPGRKIGEVVADDATNFADSIVTEILPSYVVTCSLNEINSDELGQSFTLTLDFDTEMNTSINPLVVFPFDNLNNDVLVLSNGIWNSSNQYILTYIISATDSEYSNFKISVSGAVSSSGKTIKPRLLILPLLYDTKHPFVINMNSNVSFVNSQSEGQLLIIDWVFSEPCQNIIPSIQIGQNLNGTLVVQPNTTLSFWLDSLNYRSCFDLSLIDEPEGEVVFTISNVFDGLGNELGGSNNSITIPVDAKAPTVLNELANESSLNIFDTGSEAFELNIVFDEPMDNSIIPTILFENEGLTVNPFQNASTGAWLSSTVFKAVFDLAPFPVQELYGIQMILDEVRDVSGNVLQNYLLTNSLSVDTKKPVIDELEIPNNVVDAQIVLNDQFTMTIHYSEPMDVQYKPIIELFQDQNSVSDVQNDVFSSTWLDAQTYLATFNFIPENMSLMNIDVRIFGAYDSLGNNLEIAIYEDTIQIDYDFANLSDLDNGSSNQFSIYPNPVFIGDKLNFVHSKEFIAQLTLYDFFGREIKSAFTCQGDCVIDTNSLSEGIYFLRIASEDKILDTIKFIAYE